jgi:hypothetical protein
VASELVTECLNALTAPVGLNEDTLGWVPGHCGICGNEESHKLARQASATPLTGSEPAVGILKCLAREAIRVWTIDQHYRHWRDVPGHKHGKLFISGPCKKRAEDLFKLRRHQLRMMVAILTGHTPVIMCLHNMHLFEGDHVCRFLRTGG